MNIALLGAGTVGGGLAELVSRRPELELTISKALVKDLSKSRHPLLQDKLTTTPSDVFESADILVEAMGGTGLAAELILQALQAGKPVATANKAVLAERWSEFSPYIEQGLLYFEASVMAGTPAIEPLTGSLRGVLPLELHAILNGTCNYMISQLEKGIDYTVALKEAQALGYAEADPTLDVGGFDAAHKLTILAKLVFDPSISWQQVKAATTGIENLSPTIVQDALEKGGKVRLVGSIYPQNNMWNVKMRPVFLPAGHPLGNASSNHNALNFKGDGLGDVLITGAGAGATETASGVLADILKIMQGQRGLSLLSSARAIPQNYQAVELIEL